MPILVAEDVLPLRAVGDRGQESPANLTARSQMGIFDTVVGKFVAKESAAIGPRLSQIEEAKHELIDMDAYGPAVEAARNKEKRFLSLQ